MKIELIERGQKSARPSLLFIHGAFHNAQCWDAHYLPYFAERGWHATALSLRGHGASAGHAATDNPSLNDYLDDVLQVVDTLGGPVVIAGHSMGGVLCQMAYAEREAIKGVGLIAPSPRSPAPGVVLRLMARHPIDFLRGQIAGDMEANMRVFREFFFADDMPPAEKEKAMALVDTESLQAMKDVFPRPAPPPKSRNIPFALIRGLGDWSIPEKPLRETARHFEATYIEVPGAHDVMLDMAWAQSAAAFENWLTENFSSPEN